MAAKKKKKAAKKGKPAELIISKARVKAAVKKCNVGGEFYGALDAAVRDLIKEAEGRAQGNKRKTLKAVDLWFSRSPVAHPRCFAGDSAAQRRSSFPGHFDLDECESDGALEKLQYGSRLIPSRD